MNPFEKRLWKLHQSNEYTRINRYKEGLCFACFSKDTAFAMVVDCCNDCKLKYGVEAQLAHVLYKFYAYCYFCKLYKINVSNINIRLCHKCYVRVAKGITQWRKEGGQFGADPYWKRLRHKYGKDGFNQIIRSI